MRMKMKRFLGILLSLALVLGLMPGMSLTAYAAGNGTEASPIEIGTWDDLCKNLSNLKPSGESENNPTYYKLTDNAPYPASSTYTSFEVPSGRYVVLDLAGCKIDRNLSSAVAYGYVIKVGGSLTITDSSTGKTGMITGGNSTTSGGGVYVDNGTFKLSGGTIGNNKVDSSSLGGGVYVDGGTFELTGGTISDNTAWWGGGIYVKDGTFNMTGGTISNNTSLTGNGGVYVKGGTFNMTSGTIGNNSAESYGGGVYIAGGSKFNMTDGTISNNTAYSGGGVYKAGSGTFNMTDGTISENTSDGDGGGVYIASGTFNLSGKPIIKDNQGGTSRNNVFIDQSQIITLTGALDSDASIGVTMHQPGVFTSGGIAKSYSANFTSDDNTYTVQVQDDELKLGVAPVTEYPLWVGGTQVTSANKDNVFKGDATNGGKVSYTPADGDTPATLTLNGATISGGTEDSQYAAIYAEGDLIINVTEDSTVSGPNADYNYGILATYNLSISGSSKLTVNGGSTTNGSCYGVESANGSITIGGTVSAMGGEASGYSTSYGVAASSVIIEAGGTLSAAGGTASGTGSDSYGVFAGANGLTVNGTLIANGGEASSSCGIKTFGDVSINGPVTATGLSQAIQCVNSKVKNTIPGTGWTNVGGTQGEASIKVSTEGQTFDYKMVHFEAPAHTHSFTYSESGATITAECKADDKETTCPLRDNNYQATLTINAEGGTYDGTTTYGATITNNIPAVDGDSVGDIEYYKVDTQGAITGGTKQTGAPTDAGYYYASVTLTSGDDTYAAVKAFTVTPKALTITGATLAARDYAEGNKNVTVSAVKFEGVALTLGTDYTATAVMADDTAGKAKSATVTVTLKNSNYSLAQNTYTEATVQINKIAYAGSKTAAANLRGSNGATAEVTLPALPAGASYGAVTNSNAAYFAVSTVADGKVTVTAEKDFDQATESGDKTFTVAVSGATNYNDYDVTVTITPIFKEKQTITAVDVTAIYGDTNKKVEATTDGGGIISYAVKEGSADYIEVNAETGALTIKKVGTATVVVTAAETSTYTQATKEVIVTINKANAVAATVTKNNRTYDGKEKPLVTVTGEAVGGEMQYALGTATGATEPYTPYIPSKTNAGT